MPASDWSRLASSFKSLNAAEQLATLHAMRAAFRAGSTDANTYVAALRNGVTLGEWDVIELATGFLEEIHDDLLDASQRPVFEQNMRSWFAKPLASLSSGTSATAGTSTALSKAALANLGVTLVRHPPALASFSARGAGILKSVAQAKNSITLDELAPASLWAFMSTGGTDAAEAAIEALKATREAETRNAIVRAMAAARDPAALAQIQGHVLSGELRVRELFSYLRTAFSNVDTRDASWLWLRKNFGSLVSLTGENAAFRLVQLPSSLCSTAHEVQIRKFFEPLETRIVGAPRTLANTLETVKRCADWKARAAKEVAGATLAPAK
jgi:aminopeptidase N